MVRSAVILVDEKKRTDMHRLVERVYLFPAIIVLVRIIHQPIVIAIRQVQRQQGNIAEMDEQVGVMRRRRVRIEQHDRVGKVPVRDPRNVHAQRRELLTEDCARRQRRKIEHEALRRTRAGRAGRCWRRRCRAAALSRCWGRCGRRRHAGPGLAVDFDACQRGRLPVIDDEEAHVAGVYLDPLHRAVPGNRNQGGR